MLALTNKMTLARHGVSHILLMRINMISRIRKCRGPVDSS
jgi:hypothetical protein